MKPVRDLLLPLALLLILFSCRKESFTNSASATLRTSADTLHFDTLFTSTGSTSRLFKIRNDNSKGIHISSVRLMGGNSSPFRMNVDGQATAEARNLDLAAHDSLYVFVTVTVDPTAAQLPFVVRDSVEILYNGNRQLVQLEAYGRNAHFLRNAHIGSDATWMADLPYVILGGLTVDAGATLTVDSGCRVHLHADAPFIVEGSLQVHGRPSDSGRVVFTGDRLDDPYRDFPASYPGLVFTPTSRGNVLQYAIIRNAYQGIVVQEPAASGTKLVLNETIIDNAYDAGLIGINTSITARNLLVSNCGKNVLLVKGGSYRFDHCTVVSLSNSYLPHRNPVLGISNALSENGLTVTRDLDAAFNNCIIWGEDNGLVPDEVVTDRQGSNPYSLVFNHVLWRVRATPQNASATSPLSNQDPRFDSVNTGSRFYNFRLSSSSPAVNAGFPSPVAIDLDGLPRPVGPPDLGAYERR